MKTGDIPAAMKLYQKLQKLDTLLESNCEGLSFCEREGYEDLFEELIEDARESLVDHVKRLKNKVSLDLINLGVYSD